MTTIHTLSQKKFPFIKRKYQLNLENNKLKIFNKFLFGSNEREISLDTIDDNPQRVQKTAVVWFLISIVLTAYLVACLSSWIFNPPKTADDMLLYAISQLILFIGTAYLWQQFLKESYDLMIYSNKFNNQIDFTVLTHNPDEVSYNEFITFLNTAIKNANQRSTINNILDSLPTDILVERFSFGLVNELMKRNVDVQSLLQFMLKKIAVQSSSKPE